MSNTIADRFRRWFDYEKNAHAKVVQSLRNVPADRRDSPDYRKAVSLLGHIAAARGIWLFRLGAAPKPPGKFLPADLEDQDLDTVIADLRDIESAWTRYLDALGDADLERVFEYQSYDAGRFRNRVEDILAQTFGHSWYHRGQIAMLVRKAGGQPTATDLVYWCRELLPEALS